MYNKASDCFFLVGYCDNVTEFIINPREDFFISKTQTLSPLLHTHCIHVVNMGI